MDLHNNMLKKNKKNLLGCQSHFLLIHFFDYKKKNPFPHFRFFPYLCIFNNATKISLKHLFL